MKTKIQKLKQKTIKQKRKLEKCSKRKIKSKLNSSLTDRLTTISET